jgi:hypothetical protein
MQVFVSGIDESPREPSTVVDRSFVKTLKDFVGSA